MDQATKNYARGGLCSLDFIINAYKRGTFLFSLIKISLLLLTAPPEEIPVLYMLSQLPPTTWWEAFVNFLLLTAVGFLAMTIN